MAEHEVQSLSDQVDAAVSHAIDKVVPELAGADPVIRPSERADFQANAVLALAPARAGTRPDLAAALIAALPADGPITSATVSGPGFLNITLTDEAVWVR